VSAVQATKAHSHPNRPNKLLSYIYTYWGSGGCLTEGLEEAYRNVDIDEDGDQSNEYSRNRVLTLIGLLNVVK